MAKSAATKIGVNAKELNLTDFKISKVRFSKSNQKIQLADFGKVFNVEINPDVLKNSILNDAFKQTLIDYVTKTKLFPNIIKEKNNFIIFIRSELIKEKHYEDAVGKIELSHKIIDSIPKKDTKR